MTENKTANHPVSFRDALAEEVTSWESPGHIVGEGEDHRTAWFDLWHPETQALVRVTVAKASVVVNA